MSDDPIVNKMGLGLDNTNLQHRCRYDNTRCSKEEWRGRRNQLKMIMHSTTVNEPNRSA